MSGRIESVAQALPQAISSLGNEIAAAQSRLGQIAGMLHNAEDALKSGKPTEASVRQVIRWRNARYQHFDRDLFADPAWDMLLELYASELGQRRISVSSLCIASSVPATTALRWLTILERRGLVVRKNDPLDRRRIFVGLTDKGFSAMDAHFCQQAMPILAS